MTPSTRTPTAKDFMSAEVQSVSPDLTLNDVVQFLLKKALSNTSVVKDSAEGPQLLGFISERDCLAALSNESFFGSPAPRQTAATIMRTHPVCVSPDAELFELAAIFVNHGFRHLPVTTGETLVGIVSRRDVLQAVDDFYNQTIQETTQQREHSYYQHD